MTRWTTVSIPSAPILHLARTDVGLSTIYFGPDEASFLTYVGDAERQDSDALLQDVSRQLTEYFAGRRRTFDAQLDLHGTPFQQRVWEALLRIPYGETWSYAGLANHLGVPKAFRAVGSANGRNPVPIIVPCHRVIQTGGALGGYGGGLPLKRFLLRLEGARGFQDRLDEV